MKKILRGYRGGPDFNNIQKEHYYLDEELKLTVALPVCNPLKQPKTKIVNYPFTEANWFETNYSQIESPRVCQRLNNLRNWNYEKIKSLYIRIS